MESKFVPIEVKFSESVCSKFPMQTMRHQGNASNARWMLRNPPTHGDLTPEDIQELVSWVRSMRI